jgi:cobyrinic acid a,c-diamide synthase
VPIVGGLPGDAAHAFPERHLGLRTADEEAIPAALLDAWRARFVEWNAPAAFLALARAADPLEHAPPSRRTSAPRCRIAIARDAAFHFYYPENLALLESLGAELIPFSPIADATLPVADGLYLGGGYPEVHAAQLAANEPMKAAIRAHARAGAPIYAECGGLMYLCDAIRMGGDFPMVGLVPGIAVVHDRLQALGYVEVETQAPSILGAVGLRLRGHQFRYSTLEGASGTQYRVRRRRGGSTEAEGYGADNVLASYVHAHWASNPLAAEGLVAACARRRA